jgi:hypothetical protein
MADDIGMMITKGDVFSDEKKVMKEYISRNESLFEKYEPEKIPDIRIAPEKIIPVKPKKKENKNLKLEKDEVPYDPGFDAMANPGKIPVFGPTEGEPVKEHARDLPDAPNQKIDGDIF